MPEQHTLTEPGKGRVRDLPEKYWFNAIWFQSIWLCAVLGREELLPATAALLLLHIVLVRNASRELLQLSTLAFLGIGVDACLSLAGVFQFANNALVPLWLCGLWLAFAATTARSLSFLASRPVLISLSGAVVLPLNYWAGARLGAVEFGYPLVTTLAVLAIVWTIIFPLMYKLTALIASTARTPPPGAARDYEVT